MLSSRTPRVLRTLSPSPTPPRALGLGELSRTFNLDRRAFESWDAFEERRLEERYYSRRTRDGSPTRRIA